MGLKTRSIRDYESKVKATVCSENPIPITIPICSSNVSTAGLTPPNPALLFPSPIPTLTLHTLCTESNQTFAKVASRFGVQHADKLMFGTVNRRKMAGFVETFNVYDGHPHVVVLVRKP